MELPAFAPGRGRIFTQRLMRDGMKIWKILLMVLAVAIGAPTASMAAEGHHAKRSVASAKTKKKKGKKAKGAKHAKGKKAKGTKHAKGKKAKKEKKAKKLAAASNSGHKSHAPAENAVQEPVPSVEIPQEAKDDLPPPNNGNLSE